MTEKKTKTKSRHGKIFAFNTSSVTSGLHGAFRSLFFFFFCTEVFGLSAISAGIITSISVVFDAVSDPVGAYLVEKFRIGKKGYYLPWYKIGIGFLIVGMVLMFWGPTIPAAMKPAYMIGMYLIYTIGVTIFTVAWTSLRTIVTRKLEERALYPSYGAINQILAGMFVSVGATPIITAIGGSETNILGYRIFALICAVIIILVTLVFSWSVKKEDLHARSVEKESSIKFKEILHGIKSNKAIVALAMATGSNNWAFAISTAMQIYFAKYILGDAALMSTLGIVSFAIGLPGAIIVTLIMRKTSAKFVFTLGSWASAVFLGILVILRPFSSVALTMGLVGFSFFLSQFTLQTTRVLTTDSADYGYWKTGVRMPSVYGAIESLIGKGMTALSGITTGAVLAWAGYVADMEVTNQLYWAIVILMFGAPLIGHIVSIISMKFYPINREVYHQMMEGIEKMESGESA